MNAPHFRGLARTLRPRSPIPSWFAALVLALTLVAPGCFQAEQTGAETAAPADTWFPLTVGGIELRIQLALSPAELQRGLMHRETLGPDEGMVFLFPGPGPRAFWMKNTRIPLDLAYFDADGKLAEIHPLFPYDETSVPSSSNRIQIAIETNRGWFRQHGIRPGAGIDLDQLEKAVNRRGGDYLRYQLAGDRP